MRQIPLAIRSEPPFTFDDFIQGENALTVAQVRSFSPPKRHADGAQPRAPSLYLWGPSGVGKTHLLRALTSHWSSKEVYSLQPQSTHAQALHAEIHAAMQDDQWRVLVLDACEGFTDAHQQAAFVLFVEASTRGALIVCAGRLPPIDLGLRDDLRSRLGWGLVLPLYPLTEFQSRSVLLNEAHRRGMALSDDVLDYLLTRFPRDLKHLMQLLDHLDDFALSCKRPLSVQLLRQMLLESSLVHP